jgi:signal transduction histidine kinase
VTPSLLAQCRTLLHGDPTKPQWSRGLLQSALQASGACGGLLIWFDPGMGSVAMFQDGLGGSYVELEQAGAAPSWEPPAAFASASRLQFPLRTQEGVYGVTHLYVQGEGQGPDASAMEVLEAYMSMVALILENKRTQAYLKRENDSLRLLDERAADLVSELEGKRADLASAMQTLLKGERLAVLGQLAAAVAHQIRNPLSVIGAHVELMMGELGESHSHYATLEIMNRKVSQTEAIIRELMELAKPLGLSQAPCSLLERLESISRFIAPKCRLQSVELRLRCKDGLPQVWLDASQFERCLLDLAINALQQMPSGGILELNCDRLGDSSIRLSVEDSGPGIRPEHLQRIFEPFFSQRPGGTGLGLYNVRRICQEMGIEIGAENRGQGGACFHLTVPISDSRPDPIFSTGLFPAMGVLLH